jgi:hypothetical protein
LGPGFRLALDLLPQSAHPVFAEHNVYVVVETHVQLHIVNYVHLAAPTLEVAILIRDRALAGEVLGHVVVLHVLQGLAVVFGASTHQVVHVVDQHEELAMDVHQVTQRERLASVLNCLLPFEDPVKHHQHRLSLLLVQHVSLHVLMFKALTPTEEHAGHRNEVNHN